MEILEVVYWDGWKEFVIHYDEGIPFVTYPITLKHIFISNVSFRQNHLHSFPIISIDYPWSIERMKYYPCRHKAIHLNICSSLKTIKLVFFCKSRSNHFHTSFSELLGSHNITFSFLEYFMQRERNNSSCRCKNNPPITLLPAEQQ